jgi:hypothetical protein
MADCLSDKFGVAVAKLSWEDVGWHVLWLAKLPHVSHSTSTIAIPAFALQTLQTSALQTQIECETSELMQAGPEKHCGSKG